ncbi:g11240 [Coccomyxa viridis]|uniref:G11240 protein n=1 Tax=Coccomyxa viridis TaxID=1274662 RepID=A0ABP1GA05_9CHLO
MIGIPAQGGSPAASQEHSDEVDAEAPSGVHMACFFQAGKLGIAAYDTASAEVLYTSSRADEAFLDALRKPALPESPDRPFEVRLEKSALFHPYQAVSCLSLLHVRGLPESPVGQNRLHALNTLVDLTGTEQVCAAGALLSILHREGLLRSSLSDSLAAPDRDGASLADSALRRRKEADMHFCVESLSELHLLGHLCVDSASMHALQIFQEEHHPSAMGIGQSKEGFSVFGIFNQCVSPMGKRLLRLWFRRPIINLTAIKDRQDTIEAFLRMPDVMKSLTDILKRVKDASRLLARLQAMQSAMDAKAFAAVSESIAQMLLLKEVLCSSGLRDSSSAACDTPHGSEASHQRTPGQEYPLGPTRYADGTPSASGIWSGPSAGASHELGIVRKASACITGDLMRCHHLISQVIDTDQEEGMMVAWGISEELDQLKLTYHGLPDFLTAVVERELDRIPRHLSNEQRRQLWAIVYMPQVGFLVRIEGQRLTADLEECYPDYEFAFEAKDDNVCGMYYRCERTRELQAEFGDMLHRIHDLERILCTELLQRLMGFQPCLARAVALAAEVDCLISLAQVARDHGYCRPVLTQDNLLHIKQGRHVLTELVTNPFVPNDTDMGLEAGRIQVVTGANLSGKSCYAKQVALIVFLAHIGSFVPAAEATVGLTDRIFTRIATHETVAVPQSAFLMDLSQVSAMLRHSTPRSLCIIDEFGKGTLCADGVGLLCAALRHFAAQQPSCKLIACTHFSEVLDEHYLARHPQLAFYTMEVLTGPQKAAHSSQQQEIVFLYHLGQGYAAPSFGVHCAAMAGMPPGILKRTEEVLKLRKEAQNIRRRTDERQERRAGVFRELLERLMDINTHDTHAVQHLLDLALCQPKAEC